jgi:hypothetical protein
VDFVVFIFIVVVALIVRGLVRSVNTVRSTTASTNRRRQLQQVAQRMRATAQQRSPGYPQPPTATYGREVGGPGYQPPTTASPGSTAPFEQPATARPGSTAPFSQPPTAQQTPTAAVAPPSPPLTAEWPSGEPAIRPQPAQTDPLVIDVAGDPDPRSAYPTDEPTSSAAAPDTTTPARRRYELSSSLDTTLSTSLTSSLIGQPGSIADGPKAVAVPAGLRQQVLDLMNQGSEVMAVRLVCDEMNVGILDAHKTVRSIAGLPTVM